MFNNIAPGNLAKRKNVLSDKNLTNSSHKNSPLGGYLHYSRPLQRAGDHHQSLLCTTNTIQNKISETQDTPNCIRDGLQTPQNITSLNHTIS